MCLGFWPWHGPSCSSKSKRTSGARNSTACKKDSYCVNPAPLVFSIHAWALRQPLNHYCLFCQRHHTLLPDMLPPPPTAAAQAPEVAAAPPPPAPTAVGGWQVLYAPEGRPYYHNPGTGVTQWDPPAGGV
jgi:hypothetical protein